MDIAMPPGISLSNAAGTCKTLRGVMELASSAATEILVGTIAKSPRKGNPGLNYYRSADGTVINSIGVKSRGLPYYSEYLPRMVEIAHKNGKVLGVSILPTSLDDLAFLCTVAMLDKVDVIEIDAGCGNLHTEGRILCYDPPRLEEVLKTLLALRMEARHPVELRVKVAPYLDRVLLAEVAALIGSLGTPSMRIAIVTANASSGAFMFKNEGGVSRPAIESGNHTGSWSGDHYLHVGLGQVLQFRELLPDHPIIGVGGISKGEHAQEYLYFKVKGLQVGCAYGFGDQRDPDIFRRIPEELYYCSPIPKF